MSQQYNYSLNPPAIQDDAKTKGGGIVRQYSSTHQIINRSLKDSGFHITGKIISNELYYSYGTNDCTCRL